MKFVSLRQKLLKKVNTIIIISFAVVLAVIAYTNMQASDANLAKTEESIRAALIDKGRTLVNNNSMAMTGMAEDSAFTAVQELVSNTVKDDKDLVYGIFMDVDMIPWVNATDDNPSGSVTPGEELDDEMSVWASELEELSYKIIDYNGVEVYEFAAPIMSEGEPLAFIRYGLSTSSMKDSLAKAAEQAKQTLMQTMMVVAGVVILAVGFGVFSSRRMAISITNPLDTLKDSAHSIASGDYETHIEVNTDDELGLLANNFDQMRTTIKKKMADLAKLNSTGEVLASLLDQTKALEEVLKTLHEQLGVNEGSVFLVNDDDMLEVKAYFPPKMVSADKTPAKFHKGEGIMGRAANQKKILFVPDTSKDEAFVDARGKHNAKSLICIPLMDEDLLLGVMNCSGELGDVHFESSDYEFAQSVARLLVITIKNIRMREVIEEQNRTLEHKVEERTAELAKKTNDIANMMSNMHQGLFTIMESGLVHPEYAAYLEEILETDKIANRNFMDLMFSNCDLGSDTKNQVETAIAALIGSDEMMFEFNSHLLVTEYCIHLPDGRTKILDVDWDPIVMDDEIEKIMITLRDVTELKALEKEAEAQRVELDIIGQILAIDVPKFEDFLDTSYGFIEECRNLIESTNDKDEQVIGTLFRNMHTVKGNARTYGFTFLTDSVHEVEHTYDELRKNEDKQWDQQQLLAELKTAEDDLKRYDSTAHEKLGREKDAASGVGFDQEQVTKLLNNIETLDFGALPSDALACVSDTYKMLIGTEAKPMSQVIEGVLESVISLAQELDKPQPNISIDDGELLLRSGIHSTLNNIFMHVFRNAMDHGIEDAEERKSKGKSEAGNISMTFTQGDEAVVYKVADDGRGLALDKILAKAMEQGVYSEGDQPDPDEVANLIFSSGFSTAEEVTAVSGRGVGMDAVKRFLEQEGGSIAISLEDGEGYGFRQFHTQITIPNKFVSKMPAFAG